VSDCVSIDCDGIAKWRVSWWEGSELVQGHYCGDCAEVFEKVAGHEVKPISTVSHVDLLPSPEAEAELDRLAGMPALEAIAELGRMEPWYLRDAVVRAAGRRVHG
jgi:hypothetical protein